MKKSTNFTICQFGFSLLFSSLWGVSLLSQLFQLTLVWWNLCLSLEKSSFWPEVWRIASNKEAGLYRLCGLEVVKAIKDWQARGCRGTRVGCLFPPYFLMCCNKMTASLTEGKADVRRLSPPTCYRPQWGLLPLVFLGDSYLHQTRSTCNLCWYLPKAGDRLSLPESQLKVSVPEAHLAWPHACISHHHVNISAMAQVYPIYHQAVLSFQVISSRLSGSGPCFVPGIFPFPSCEDGTVWKCFILFHFLFLYVCKGKDILSSSFCAAKTEPLF